MSVESAVESAWNAICAATVQCAVQSYRRRLLEHSWSRWLGSVLNPSAASAFEPQPLPATVPVVALICRTRHLRLLTGVLGAWRLDCHIERHSRASLRQSLLARRLAEKIWMLRCDTVVAEASAWCCWCGGGKADEPGARRRRFSGVASSAGRSKLLVQPVRLWASNLQLAQPAWAAGRSVAGGRSPAADTRPGASWYRSCCRVIFSDAAGGVFLQCERCH
mmetsp:Transcript_22654/g.51075  ORF Transcript_22654/g.51075 Transcript_22654/m.51075 type:complete len:221 (-) Transcript_22654:1227-1889(-)